MRWRSTRAAVVLIGAIACTAGPAVLPIGEEPGPPTPCPERPVVTGAVATGAVAEPAVAAPRVLGRSWIARTDSDRIRWFDPVTLQRTDAYWAALPEQTSAWAVSPAGGLIAIGLQESIRVIDTATFRTIAELPPGGGSSTLAWLSDGTLVSVGWDEARIWDEGSWNLRPIQLPSAIVAQFVASDRLLLVTGRDVRGVGAPRARLVEIRASGVRSFSLERIEVFDAERGEIGVGLVPGLAYDPLGRRVFVIPPEGPIAEVHLSDGSVRYEPSPASFLRTIAASFLPAAVAKMGEWELVRAVWLGDGLLAVSGETGGTLDLDVSAAGVSIVDTRDWSVCLLDPRPTRVAVSDGVLLTWGGAEFGEFGGTGLVGYDLRDGDRWHRFGRQYLDLQFYGRYAYAINSWRGWRVRTVDLSTGAVIARHRGRPPAVLPTGSMSAW